MEKNGTEKVNDGMEPDKMHTAWRQGTAYKVPNHPEYPQHRVGALSLDVGGDVQISTVDFNRLMILPRDNMHPSLWYGLYEINNEYKPMGNDPIQLALYKKGVGEPLFCTTIHEKKYSVNNEFNGITMSEGDYFIYLGNAQPTDLHMGRYERFGTGYVYDFRIMEHGSRLRHPKVHSSHVDADLNLCLTLDRTMKPERELLTCECYDESCRLVATSTEMHVSGDDVILPMNPKGWWVDGSFHILVYLNNSPSAHFSFEWKDYMPCNTCQEALMPESKYYVLHRITKNTPHGTSFGNLCGCRNIKKRILRICGKGIVPVRPYVIYSDYEPDSAALRVLFRILYPYHLYGEIDCKTVAEDIRAGKPLDYMKELFERRHIVVVHHLEYLLSKDCAWFMEHLFQQANYCESAVVLHGTIKDVLAVYERDPRWEAILENDKRWDIEPYSFAERVYVAEHFFKNRNMEVSYPARILLMQTFDVYSDLMEKWRTQDIEDWLKKNVLARQKSRVMGYDTYTTELLMKIEQEDINTQMVKPRTVKRFDGTIAELDNMVGLKDIKKHLRKLFWQISFQRKRDSLGFCTMRQVLPHMVFTGNPGTGKTTVAELVGKAFKKLGLLKKGEVITVDRTTLVGRFIGETENRMKDILSKAKGNVLFIDEAYSLCDNDSGDRKDYGCRVLECLLPVLADPGNDTLVILAGYEDQMEQMLALNPGMKGRFPYTFHFKDYNADELKEIAVRLLDKMDYLLEAGAEAILRKGIERVLEDKDKYFHNGRWATQLVQEGILGAMAERLFDVEASPDNREKFRIVKVEDVEKGLEQMHKNAKPARTKVGFR